MPCSPCVYRKQTANTSFLLPVSEVHLKTARLNCFVFQTQLGIASVVLILHCSGSFSPQVNFSSSTASCTWRGEQRPGTCSPGSLCTGTKPCCSLLLSWLLSSLLFIYLISPDFFLLFPHLAALRTDTPLQGKGHTRHRRPPYPCTSALEQALVASSRQAGSFCLSNKARSC